MSTILGKLKNKVAQHTQHEQPTRREIPPPKHKLSRASTLVPPPSESSDTTRFRSKSQRLPSYDSTPTLPFNQKELGLEDPKIDKDQLFEIIKLKNDEIMNLKENLNMYQQINLDDLVKLEEEKKELQEKLVAYPLVLHEKDSLKKNYEELVIKSNQEKMMIEQLENKLKILEKEHSNLEMVKKAIQGKLLEAEEFKGELLVKNRKITELETALDKEKRKNSELVTILEREKRKNSFDLEKNTSKEENLENLQNELENLKIELKSKNSKMEELEHENSVLNSFNKTQQQLVNTLRQRCIEYESTGKKTPIKTPNTENSPTEKKSPIITPNADNSPTEKKPPMTPNTDNSPKDFDGKISAFENIIENLRNQNFRYEQEKKEFKSNYVDLLEKIQENERVKEETQLNWGISKKVISELETKLEEEIKSKNEIQEKLEMEIEKNKKNSELSELNSLKNTFPGQPIDIKSDLVDQIRQLNNEKQFLIDDLKNAQYYSNQLEEQIKKNSAKGVWWWDPLFVLVVAVFVIFIQWITK